MAFQLAPVVLAALLGAACGSEARPTPAAAPAPAAATAEAVDPALQPGLQHQQLKQVLGQAEPAVRGCFTIAFSGKEGGNGRLVVDFSVRPDGSVSKASVAESTLNDPTLEECVVKVYETLKFPKAPGSTDASYPYNFRNDAEAAAATE